ENGHPVSRDEGRLYLKWVNNVCKRGYRFDHRLLNSANYGARTSRTRFFGIFAQGNLPISFPDATHCKGGSKPDMFSSGLKPWNPVRDVLELDNEGESIFERKKPLVDKTLERIYAGLIKFVAGGKDAFLSRYNSVRPQDTAMSLDEPCGVVTTENRFATVKVQFLSKQFSGEPNSKNQSIDEPSGAITCKDHHAIINAQFLDAHYNNGFHRSIDEPAPTMTCKDHFSLVTSHFLDEQYGNGTPANINEPAKTITTNPKHTLVSVKPWIMNTNFGNVGSRLEEPAPVITANHKQHYLMNPQFASKGGDINAPCFTLIARMDKMPPYIITTEKGETAILIYENDSPAMKRVKEFMAIYRIVDIKMRMLNVGELKRIMGFGSDYTLIGTQTEQKKFIGNAVEVNMSTALCTSLYKSINNI
ncbi:MAG: DNA cytosine methyltransferase, partial [Paludibacteraceae bacterium]|nr:DNA cytosine methyltransferase [Paludibacteraceae bacterium]